jgi:hypothetical protein
VDLRERENIVMSKDSSVGTAKNYGLDGRGLIPDIGKKIFLCYTLSRPALGATQPPIQRVLGTISPGVKRLRSEADHSPPSNVEVKNGGAIPPL